MTFDGTSFAKLEVFFVSTDGLSYHASCVPDFLIGNSNFLNKYTITIIAAFSVSVGGKKTNKQTKEEVGNQKQLHKSAAMVAEGRSDFPSVT